MFLHPTGPGLMLAVYHSERWTKAETHRCSTSEHVLRLTHNLDADLTSAFALFWFYTKEKEWFVSILISWRSPAELQYGFKHVTTSHAASSTWTATRVTEPGNILKCISLRCAVENRAKLRIAEYSMCVYEGWVPRGAAPDTDRHAGRGELICSSALSCSNTHNAFVPWVASLQ